MKTAYAGFVWESDEFAHKVATAAEQLEQLRQAPRTIPPGHYRVYLAPAALEDILHTLAWGGLASKITVPNRLRCSRWWKEGRACIQQSHSVRTPAMGWHQTFKEQVLSSPTR